MARFFAWKFLLLMIAHHRFNIVPPRILDERGPVPGTIVRPGSWRPIVGAACGKARLVKRLDSFLVLTHERDVHRRDLLGLADPEIAPASFAETACIVFGKIHRKRVA